MARPRTPLSGAALALLACFSACSSAPAARPHVPPPVVQLGSMQEQMMAGAPSEGVALADVLAKPHAYAIGPLAGLRGELFVWDGTPFHSRIVDGTAQVRVEPGVRAAFLLASHVRQWRDFAVPADVNDLAELTAWLPRLLEKNRLGDDRLYALRLFGVAKTARLHVVDLAPGTPLDPDSLAAAGRPLELKEAPVQLLGFLAPPGQSTCPIASPPLHLHLRTLLGDVVGHVDDLTLAPGATLELAWN
ncbi:MAG: acetolactate decarboxylase [Planctomycetes bacterium]|nr:acetolactate decarboxylase [Planctomycetota bacterium]